MIKNLSLNKQEVYKKDVKNSSYSQPKEQSFKGFAQTATSAATAVLQYCNTNPMAGVSLIDGVTAIAPRTIVDAKTNGFAAAETFRRESSGLIVNCLIPGFIVLGVAKVLEMMGIGEKGWSKMWANQDALETFKDHFHDIKNDEHAAKNFINRLLDDAKVLNSNRPSGLKNAQEWIPLNHENLKTEIDDYINVIKNNVKDTKVINKVRKNLYDKILKESGGAEHIKIGIFKEIEENGTKVFKRVGEKVYHDNISTLLRDAIDVGQNFIHKQGCDKTKIAEFVKKATKFINKKSIIGLGIVIPLAASMQSINRWITRKTSGQEGAPIYKDFIQNNNKKKMSPAEKSKFWTSKIAAAGLMVGVAMLSMMKKPSLKMLQFTKNMPSMDQCRWIATATFASRMLAAEDQNELSEATWRDIATFSSLYFLGDYVSKGVGTIIQKYKKVPLLNYMKDAPENANTLNKFIYWVKDTKLKSFDEANAIKGSLGGTKAKHLRAICELSSLGFSMLLLGVLVPWYVRKQTEIKHQKEMTEKLNSFHTYPSLNFSNKKTFQAFGMLEPSQNN